MLWNENALDDIRPLLSQHLAEFPSSSSSPRTQLEPLQDSSCCHAHLRTHVKLHSTRFFAVFSWIAYLPPDTADSILRNYLVSSLRSGKVSLLRLANSDVHLACYQI